MLQAPTRSLMLEGRWKLLYTTTPGTASPIQRSFVGVDAFSVFQEIVVVNGLLRVNNIVSFGNNVGELKASSLIGCPHAPMHACMPPHQPSDIKCPFMLFLCGRHAPSSLHAQLSLPGCQVEAEANTDLRKLPGFTPRKGKGLPIFGKSSSEPPTRQVPVPFLEASLPKLDSH